MKAHTYGNHNIKELFLAILPAQIFSFITSSLSGIVNGLVIGNYLTNLDMVALGFASPLTQIITVCATIVSAGARIVCGKYIGRGEKEKVNKTFTSAIYLLLIIGGLLTITGLVFAKPIASIVASSQAIEKTTLYIRGISIGILPTVIIPCLMVFLQMENEGNFALLSTGLLAILNLVLALGAMKFIGIDIFGVGLVTSISQYLTLLFIVIRFISIKNLPRLTRGGDKYYNQILIIGIPSALSGLLYACRNSVLNGLASTRYGIDTVNALSILNASCGPFDAINIGVGQAFLMLASIYIGERDKEALKSLAKIAIKVGLILAFIKVILIFLFGGYIADAYNASVAVKEITIHLYNAYSLCMPLNILTVVIMNSYQGLGKVTYCNILLLINAIICPLSLAYFVNNVYGIFYCYAFAEIAVILLMILIAFIKNKKFESIGDILVIDREIEIGSHIAITVRTIEEVVDVSKKIQDYCLSEGIDSNRSMLAGLVSEEVAANIVEHGFSKSKKRKNSIDIFVDVYKDEVNIRIKDNAVAFDPHIKINEGDPTTNVGIKMVSKLAKEMIYQNTFGLNVLTITM